MKNTNGRAQQMLDLLRQVGKFLPDMNITFTGHDVPWVTMSGETRAKHLEAAREGHGECRTSDPETVSAPSRG